MVPSCWKTDGRIADGGQMELIDFSQERTTRDSGVESFDGTDVSARITKSKNLCLLHALSFYYFIELRRIIFYYIIKQNVDSRAESHFIVDGTNSC